MLAFGSGHPTWAIRSTLIAQAYPSIRYPILPRVERDCAQDDKLKATVREILYIRHYSLFALHDFDISPYFQVIKPAVEQAFDHRELKWAN